MASTADTLATLKTLNDLVVNQISPEVTKIGTETTGLQKAVADLTAALANVQTTPEVDAALAALQASLGSLVTQVKTVDDLVPDQPVAP